MAQSNMTRTVGLALEGGGYRGMYTAGVLDVWMEHGLTCDHMVGVSAGAAFGYNFKSRQIGRAIRYNKAYCADKRYASVTSWLRTGDMYNADFAYHEVPIERDPIDLEAYRTCPMRFTCVCTDIETGKAVYHDCRMATSAISSGFGRRRQFPWRRVPLLLTGISIWMVAWLILFPARGCLRRGMTAISWYSRSRRAL